MTILRTVAKAASAMAFFIMFSLNPVFAGHHEEAEAPGEAVAEVTDEKLDVMPSDADEAMLKQKLDEMQQEEMDKLEDKMDDMDEAEEPAPE